MKALGLPIGWVASVAIRCAFAATEASHTLWYSKPADRIFYEALPIGNGKLGAMIHGYTDNEIIMLNEESIWSGGYMKNKYPPRARENLPKIREQILMGNLTEAGETWSENFVPDYDDMRRYQPAGEFNITFGHTWNDTTEYRRDLDISTGIASVSYVYDGVTYTREVFGNLPHNVLAYKYTASGEGALNFDIALTRQRMVVNSTAKKCAQTLTLHGTGEEDDTYRFASKARLVLGNSVGKVHSNSSTLAIRGANEVWIFSSIETAYKHPEATYAELEAIVDERLDAAIEKGYDSLRQEAVDDYKQYYDRTSIDLGTSADIGKRDILARIENWKRGTNITTDPELMALQFNYGKYLLIQSSRPGTLPANLQGIWSHSQQFKPPWDSKFTLNVNLEMNYWFAQPLNLPEITVPVVDLLDRLAVTGKEVAKGMYGAEGWCCHHNTDITGDCTPFHGLTIAAPYPLGGAWVAFEAIEHYRFTGDKEFARTRVLPLLKGAMDFIYSYATERDGYWITNPSCSPENSYYIPEGMSVAGENTGIDAGATNDRAIMWEIMTGWIQISEGLGLTEGVEKARDFRDKIQGPVAGSFGQLLEYSREYEENEPGHRHFSMLVGLQPGTWTTPLTTPEDAVKAQKLLKWRMDNGSGGNSWSVTWAGLLHARLFDGVRALQLAMQLINRWVHASLMSRNGSYFQIDGNSGYTASIVEMFLQSHAGVLHLGPAMPPAGMGLDNGSFKGWIARGGFKVDMTWKNGAVSEAEITSLLGNPLKIRVGNGSKFTVGANSRVADGEETKTEVGQTIKVTV
ncbi:Alpha-L-fucosidase 2 [Paramyrothecium foliicola]|nr:Alpha-L-fucosidase 2 [Paramyrothecium foliicola]